MGQEPFQAARIRAKVACVPLKNGADVCVGMVGVECVQRPVGKPLTDVVIKLLTQALGNIGLTPLWRATAGGANQGCMDAWVAHDSQLGLNLIKRDPLSTQPVTGLGEGSGRTPDALDRIVFKNPLDREGTVGVDQQRLLLVRWKRLNTDLCQGHSVIPKPSQTLPLQTPIINPVLRVHQLFEQRTPRGRVNAWKRLMRV